MYTRAAVHYASDVLVELLVSMELNARALCLVCHPLIVWMVWSRRQDRQGMHLWSCAVLVDC